MLPCYIVLYYVTIIKSINQSNTGSCWGYDVYWFVFWLGLWKSGCSMAMWVYGITQDTLWRCVKHWIHQKSYPHTTSDNQASNMVGQLQCCFVTLLSSEKQFVHIVHDPKLLIDSSRCGGLLLQYSNTNIPTQRSFRHIFLILWKTIGW